MPASYAMDVSRLTYAVMIQVDTILHRVPEREYEIRKDLREERIFTVDPQSAKDLDDALSIRANDDGTYDVGVHVADVSYFVKPNTALDRDARKRATSVYLVQRSVPMLPPTLSEEVCSLNPGVERLAFSVIFTMTKEGKVVHKWMGKTVIKSVPFIIKVDVFSFYVRSSAKLSYTEAQTAIDGHHLGDVMVASEHSALAIEHDVKVLNDLAKQIRAKRFQDGAMGLSSTRLEFTLDEDGHPVDCGQTENNDANIMVEEVCASILSYADNRF